MNQIVVVDDELRKPANAERFRRSYPLDDLHYLFAGTADGGGRWDSNGARLVAAREDGQ